MSTPSHRDAVTRLRDLASSAGLRKVSILAWRDLDDPEAGGSEVHAANIAALWAEAGMEITMRTSFAAGHPQVSRRDGYRVIRKAGRYMVFPRAAFTEMMGWHGGRDGLVEIWNGMPFFSPLWSRTPHVTWFHHVHAEMWNMTLPPRLATAGRVLESRIAPRFYRRTPIVTLSDSSKRDLVEDLGFADRMVRVVPPGIDPRFTPGAAKADRPLVVAVGRLVPVKRFEVLIPILVDLKRRVPDLEAVIVGEGYRREDLEEQIRAAGAEAWLTLPGRIGDDALVDLYRRAWVLASVSSGEGWGMTITEAAACATPAVATRITGHVDAIVEGSTGLLGDGPGEVTDALERVLCDPDLRSRLSSAARAHAEQYTWEHTAEGTLRALAEDAVRRRGAPHPH